MKKAFFRAFAVVLAVLMLSVLFVACVDNEDKPDDTTAGVVEGDVTEAGATTDAWGRPIVSAPIGADFKAPDNTVITVLMRSNNKTYTREFYSPDGENGETLNDEIYRRNIRMEDNMNFTFNFLEGGETEEVSTKVLAELQSGGSSGYDIVTNYAYFGTNAALRNCYTNLTELDYFDSSNPWWNPTYVDAATIQDKLFFVVGDLNLSIIDRSLTIYYNRRIGQDLGLPNFYDVVLNDAWTIEALLEATANTWQDSNTSGAADGEDFFGIIACSNSEAYDGFLTAFGIDYTSRDSDGVVGVAWDSEKVSSAIDLQIQLYSGNNGGWVSDDWELLGNKFTNGTALFHLHLIYGSAAENANIRNMDDPYGLLPLPKYNEEQESYRTTSQDAYNVMSVMSTSKNMKVVGAVLEQWNYHSYDKILPIYCELVMKSKYLKDSESGQIFDIIVDSITFDTAMVYGQELDAMATSTRSIVKSGNNTFASSYKTSKVLYTRLLERLQTAFEDMD